MMDLRRGRLGVFELVFAVGSLLLLSSVPNFVSANLVFKVQHKFAGREKSLSAFKAHDARRHGRSLAAVDLPLGGNGSPTDTALYFTKIGVGTPSKDYYLQVDTGSDFMWVNCVGCQQCPKKSDLGIDLKLYDPKGSSTAQTVGCGQDFCIATMQPKSCTAGQLCNYVVGYGDGSSSRGFFVQDAIKLDQASGNLQTTPMNGSISFGCGNQQGGQLGQSNQALDGILGFGQSNSSMLSQLATDGKVKKVFSHCLDNSNGGGIFAIGRVVQPKIKSTPMIPDQPHYNILLKSLEVGGAAVDLPTDIFDSDAGKAMVVDSGTTLAYLQKELYNPIIKKILAAQPDLKLHLVEDQFSCFEFNGNIDDGFPVVKFHFENSLLLAVYPHDYLFAIRDNVWCIGWQVATTTAKSQDGKELNLLGDMVLSNKIVVYDLENQTIGWAEHNCSVGVTVKDDKGEYVIGPHDISSAGGIKFSPLLLLLLAIVHSRFHS